MMGIVLSARRRHDKRYNSSAVACYRPLPPFLSELKFKVTQLTIAVKSYWGDGMIDHRLSSLVYWVEKRRLSNTAEYFVSPGNRTGGGHVVLFLARAMATALVWQQSQSVVGSGSSVW